MKNEISLNELIEYIFKKAEYKNGIVKSRLSAENPDDLKYLTYLEVYDEVAERVVSYDIRPLIDYVVELKSWLYSERIPAFIRIDFDYNDGMLKDGLVITINPELISALSKFHYLFHIS